MEDAWPQLDVEAKCLVHEQLTLAARSAKREWFLAGVVYAGLYALTVGVLILVYFALSSLLVRHVHFLLVLLVPLTVFFVLAWLSLTHPRTKALFKSWRDSRTYWDARADLLHHLSAIASERLDEA